MALKNICGAHQLSTFNTRLALAIPTFNRSAILGENLRIMLPELIKYRIPVYISDDSTDFHTKNLIIELTEKYPYIFYRLNEPSLGHDANFFATLNMPDTDYVWYLGDSMFVLPGGIEDVFKKLKLTPDLCFVNGHTKDIENRSLNPNDVRPFLLDKTWFLTLSGATIYGRNPRSLRISNARKKQWKNFPQLGLILEYCSLNQTSCYWLGKPTIKVNNNKRSYWEKTAFKVFVHDWTSLIKSFPDLFSPDESSQVIRSHAINTRLFSFRSLLRFRAIGALTPLVLKEYEQDFLIASPISPFWAKLISFLPQSSLAMLLKISFRTKHLLR